MKLIERPIYQKQLDELIKLIREIESGKTSLDTLLRQTDSDVKNALKLARTALEGSQKRIQEFENNYIRKDLELSGMFNKTTNSYKFFWFRAICQIVQRCRENDQVGDESLTIEFKDLVLNMLADAWYMVTVHKLRFGKQDKIAEYISQLNEDFPEQEQSVLDNLTHSINRNTLIQKFRTSEEFKKIASELTKYVPYAFVSSFTGDKLTDRNGNLKPAEVSTYSQIPENFAKLPYEVDSSAKTITLNLNYQKFLISYPDIINGWAQDQLITYLEKKNPLVPNIRQKIEMDANRGDLTAYKNLWKSFTSKNKCIDYFDGKTLTIADFEGKGAIGIDHFIPWSYMTSDNCWNLAPIKQTHNSSKSNKLIGMESEQTGRYINSQFELYKFINDSKPKNYTVFLDEYYDVFNSEKLNEEEFKGKLDETLKDYTWRANHSGFAMLS